MADAVRLALERNHQLRAQRLNVDLSKADEITAALKPNPIFLSTNELFPVFTPSQLTWDNFANNQNFVESVTYLFERGGKREKRTQVARDTTERRGRRRRRTPSGSSRSRREQAFINVLLAKSTLDLARENLKNFSNVVDVNRERLRAGDLAEADFFKISLQKLQFEQDLSAAEVALVQAKAALRQNVGYESLTDDFEVDGDSGLPEIHRHARRPEARRAGGAAGSAAPRRAASRSPQHTQALALANRARDITGGVEYDRAGSLNALGFTRVDRPAVPRSEPGQHRAQQGRASRRRRRLEAFARSTVADRRRQRRTPRSRRARRSWRSISPATWIRRSSRSTSRPTCISRAAARCSTCSTPSARIGRRSWRIARRWRRT